LSIIGQLDESVDELTALVKRQTATLNADLVEVGTPGGSAGANIFTFLAQTGDLELITSGYFLFPSGYTNIQLNLGKFTIPLAPGFSQLINIGLIADRTKRTVTYSGGTNGDQVFVVLFGVPAPGGNPGVLHG